MSKILIYSHCFVFSGSEHVIENILKSDEIRKKHRLLFYYANSREYRSGVERKFTDLTDIHPIGILSAYGNWGNRAKIKRQEHSLFSYYLLFRYLISYFFQRIGFHDLYNTRLLYKLFKRESPDLLYINNGGYPGARSCRVAVISAKLAGINKIILNVNNLAFPQKGMLDKWLDNFINRNISVFVTASKAAGKQMVDLRKFSPSKHINIPNTISKADEAKINLINGCLKKEFHIDNNKIILGSVGLLTHRKGFHVLLEAVSLLKKENAAAYKLIIFGEGEQRSLLEVMIKEYGLQEIVILAGYRNDILQYMKDFDVVICPSIANEDFPYVILEAMLLAKPIIGTNIAGIPEQVTDNYNGFIVNAGNANELADAIRLFFYKPELITTMGQNGFKRYSEKFNNNFIMHCYDELFSSL